MKKLLLLTAVLLAVVGCSKDDATTAGGQTEEAFFPHFYGAAMLNKPSPATRGVANTLKIWSLPMAAENLTVKFLNGTERYREFVKEVAKEWEKNAGVRFDFVKDNESAIVRVGFDYVPGMMSSWALTGTDHMQVYNQQTEPTVHFAQWRRASDALKRSDVLRAFGQVLGLELEFRHPSFNPSWITDANGNVDEAAIQDYWENELAGYISWNELKNIVLNPLSDQTFLISKTDNYDSESVMTWPFYEMIAQNIPPIEFDEDYNTELSVQDKTFIQSLYGESFGDIPPVDRIMKLIEFDYTGNIVRFTLTTAKNLVVIWDEEAKEATRIDMPADTTSEFTTTVSHNFTTDKTYRIIIGEMLERGQTRPTESTALTKFDLTNGNGAKNFDIKVQNKALWYIRIIGGSGFTNHEFNFTGYDNLKELYLVETLDSKVTVKDCPNLEVLATSRFIWKPESVTGPQKTSAKGNPVDSVYQEIAGPIIDWPENPPMSIGEWPDYSEWSHSISDSGGTGITIENCAKLKTISLEHTRINHIDFSNLNNLEYVYLSSPTDYIVGGGLFKVGHGQYLVNAIRTLIDRTNKNSGLVVLRSISMVANVAPHPFTEIPIYIENLTAINDSSVDKNWIVVFDSGCKIYLKK